MKMKKRVRLCILVFLVLLLFLVRAFEDVLFYDPFLHYFENDYLQGGFPDFKMVQLFINLFFRFLLNSIISLFIIYFIFLSKETLLFAVKFHIITFVVLGVFFYIHLLLQFSNGYLFAFYLRRILIHPVLLLILIPTFYFQRRMKV